jgi:hypothetical protein
MIELTLSCPRGRGNAPYICMVKAKISKAQYIEFRDLRFSYGKQSLEVDCFYSGPFFFLTLSATTKPRKTSSQNFASGSELRQGFVPRLDLRSSDTLV